MNKGELQEQIRALSSRLKNLEKAHGDLDHKEEIKDLKNRLKLLNEQMQSNITPWERTKLARHEKRPYTLDYVQRLFENFVEIHGDRKFADDRALVAGMAEYHQGPVVVIGHQKGRTLKERLHRNYGMAQPEGYRKALRVMKLAEKFNRPIICFVDTPGAYPGIGAEERGIAEAIANSLKEMSEIEVPIVVLVIGEGGSGGALGIAVGDYVMMLENAVYSVISPESCSAILWRDQDHAEEAAAHLKLTAEDLLKFGLIEEIIPEPTGGAHADYDEIIRNVDQHLSRTLARISALPVKQLLKLRYEKFRKIGFFEEQT